MKKMISQIATCSLMAMLAGCASPKEVDPFLRDSLPTHWNIELRDMASGKVIRRSRWFPEEKEYLLSPAYQAFVKQAEPGACTAFQRGDGILLLHLSDFDWSRDTVIVKRELRLGLRLQNKASEATSGFAPSAQPEPPQR